MDALTIWTIYKHPVDFPDHYVARQFGFKNFQPYPTQIMLIHKTLDGLRVLLPSGLVKIDRDAIDSPSIIENWI